MVVNWNGGELIENCISSLKMTDYSNYKLFVVDNGSADNSIKRLKKIFPGMEVIMLNNNYGCSPGRNVAFHQLMKDKSMDYICLMDSDIITVQKNWLTLQIKELEKDRSYGISGGKLVFPDNRLQVLVRKDRANFEEKDKGQYDFIRETDAVWGACMIIKRKVWFFRMPNAAPRLCTSVKYRKPLTSGMLPSGDKALSRTYLAS